MPQLQYTEWKPQDATLLIVAHASKILIEYADEGYELTLRQLYYQFIARDLFPESWCNDAGTKNTQQSYNKLGTIISKAREAGYIDWAHITDRGRQSVNRAQWDDASVFLASVIPQFAMDLWEPQQTRIEVWVEKDALSDVVRRACRPWGIPYMACKGYMSASAMWQAAHNRMLHNCKTNSQRTIVLHLGDHDPSGIDMSRDIEDRLRLFGSPYGDGDGMSRAVRFGQYITVRRIALTMDQIREQAPPPNPAKATDSRYRAYRDMHGDESWELDALQPAYLVDLITTHIEAIIDRDEFDIALSAEVKEREWLQRLLDIYPKKGNADDSV